MAALVPEAWKLAIDCPPTDLAALEDRLVAHGETLAFPPTITTTEVTARLWRLEAYYLEKPELPPELRNAFAAHALEPVYPDDWVRKSQEGLKPIRAGRFHVYSRASAASLPCGKIGLRIEAGPAFGTGQHATTTGCLLALDRLAKRHGAATALDLGTGTAILAMGIARRFGASVIASDIDAPSIEFARQLLRENRFRPERSGRPRTVETAVCAGLDHPRLRARARYDLIAANILATPLIDLAPALSRALKPGGLLILAGLLDSQEQAVRQSYQAQGLVRHARLQRGEWPTLVLRKRQASL